MQLHPGRSCSAGMAGAPPFKCFLAYICMRIVFNATSLFVKVNPMLSIATSICGQSRRENCTASAACAPVTWMAASRRWACAMLRTWPSRALCCSGVSSNSSWYRNCSRSASIVNCARSSSVCCSKVPTSRSSLQPHTPSQNRQKFSELAIAAMKSL